jgi:hypothetical protein
MKILVLVLALATTAVGQTPSKKTPEQLQALFEQHKGDFDYLLGDWQFTARQQAVRQIERPVEGRSRLATGQILDEYRLVDDKGATFYVTATIRNYDAAHDRWELIGMDDRNGLQDSAPPSGWAGNANRARSSVSQAAARPSCGSATTIITANSFSWAGDQSTDNGKTWVKDHIRIEAKRIGPARTLPQLAKTK